VVGLPFSLFSGGSKALAVCAPPNLRLDLKSSSRTRDPGEANSQSARINGDARVQLPMLGDVTVPFAHTCPYIVPTSSHALGLLLQDVTVLVSRLARAPQTSSCHTHTPRARALIPRRSRTPHAQDAPLFDRRALVLVLQDIHIPVTLASQPSHGAFDEVWPSYFSVIPKTTVRHLRLPQAQHIHPR
jgi:hypothetical protein